jgi:hypothetical protein
MASNPIGERHLKLLPHLTAQAKATAACGGLKPYIVKVIHTLVWFSVESCMVYLLAAGLAKRSDRRAAAAAAVVGAECLIFATNGFRCPLTQLATSLGAESGSVTDIYLPAWFARHLPAIHVPLIVLTACLHGRNLCQQKKRRLEAGSSQKLVGTGETRFVKEKTPPRDHILLN